MRGRCRADREPCHTAWQRRISQLRLPRGRLRSARTLGGRLADAIDSKKRAAGYPAALRVDHVLPLPSLLPALLLQLLEPRRISADPAPRHVGELRAPLHESALSHRHSSLAAYRFLRHAALPLDRISTRILSRLSFWTFPPSALSSRHYSAVGQLSCARVCVEGDLRQ